MNPINNDRIVSWIRTVVPIIIGVALSWAVRHGLPVASIDDAQAATYVTPMCIAGYYSTVRWLETRWPQLGWLLGVAKAPQYVPGPAPAPAAGEAAVAVVEPAPAAKTGTSATRHRLPEKKMTGKRLGRHLHHDPRSRDYRAPVDTIIPATKVWARHAGPFDQGNLGSCTGNAIVGLAMTAPVWTSKRRYTETTAVKCYKLATQLDGFPGIYPPDDTGSSGLAACKAAVKLGYATRYLWGFGIDDMIRILSGLGPCAVGTDWHAGFDNPDVNGLVHLTGAVRGGHEYEVLGYHHDLSLGAPVAECFEAQNSWGAGWGVKGTGGKGGRFFITVADMTALLANGGDVVTLATASKPA